MKLKRYIFILIVLFIAFLFPYKANALELTLSYGASNGCGFTMLPSYDNTGSIDGFLFLDGGTNIKYGLDNKLIYKKYYDSNLGEIGVENIYSNVDSEYNIAGSSDLLITGYDKDGNKLFIKQYGGNGEEEYISYFKAYNDFGINDGNVVVFRTDSSDLDVIPGYVMVKFDLNGGVVWKKNINDYYNKNLYYVVDNKVDSIFYIKNSSLEKKGIISQSWEKNTNIDLYSFNYSYDKNGNFDGVILVGAKNDTGIIIKYDLDGNIIFSTVYDKSDVYSYFTAGRASYLPDGTYDGYIVVAVTSDNKTLLLKYNYEGIKVYEKTISDSSNINFLIFNNYDSSGRKNGYLLYERGIPSRKDDSNTEIYSRKDNCYYRVLKYTYDMFPVAKEETSGGTITVKSDAYPGEMVKVKVLVKEGYSLARIIVKDESGKEIEVNSDGTFVMPEGKVTVSAIYKRVTNPDTVSAAYMVLGVVLLIAVGSLIVIKNKNRDM